MTSIHAKPVRPSLIGQKIVQREPLKRGAEGGTYLEEGATVKPRSIED